MASDEHRFASLWDRDAPMPVRTLAMVSIAGGLSCLLAAAFPADPDAPVALLRVAGVLVLAAAAVLWWIGPRMRAWGLQAAVAIGTLGISLIVARSATGLGMVVTACAYLWICVYAGFFFTRTAARLHMALIAAGFGAALLISDNAVPVNAWVFMTLSVFIAGETLGRQSALLRHEAHTDLLTGALNRKGLVTATNRTFSLADRTGIPLTVALVDLDDFKQVNDRDGHPAGDWLLTRVAEVWSEELELSDIFARLGGDEFLVVLVGWGRPESESLLARMRLLSPAPWSAGVIERRPGEDLTECVAKADAALYEEKHALAQPRRAALQPVMGVAGLEPATSALSRRRSPS